MSNSNPINVEKALRGIDFPANKEAILSKAKENGAENSETSALQRLPEREYNDAAEVAEALAGRRDNHEAKE